MDPYVSRVPAWQRAIADALSADESAARKRTAERDLAAIARVAQSPFTRRALAAQLPANAIGSRS